jgi:tetratricopeptide (TPR) repeat protein
MVLYEAAFGKDRKEFPQLPSDLERYDDHANLLELNEVIVKACESDPRKRYQSAEEMKAELALLEQGKSVKHQRSAANRRRVYKKMALVTALVAFIAMLDLIGLRQFKHTPSASGLRPSPNHEATRLYDQARHIADADNYQRYGLAWSNLTVAVQLDTNFTAAYALMSRMALGHSWALQLEDRMLTMRQLATRLMTLDSRLAESYSAQASVQFCDWEFEKADASIRQAIKANPDYWLAHLLHGYYLCQWGHAERSERELRIAEKMEPSYAMIQFQLGRVYYLRRDYDTAAKQFEVALNLNDRLPWARYNRARVFLIKHDYPRAIEEFRKAEISFGGSAATASKRASQLLRAFNMGGETGYWQKCLALEQMGSPPDDYNLACIYARLGQRAKAIDSLGKSIHTRQSMDGGPVDLKVDECWNGLRNDPEFKKLVAEMRFPP